MSGTRFDLRCHSCSHYIGEADEPMRIVGLFRPSLFGRLPTREGEVRKVCGRCRWVNVFRASTWRDVETKRVLTSDPLRV